MSSWVETSLTGITLSIVGRRHLRSAVSKQLDVPEMRFVLNGSRPFYVCGPAVWNSLPHELFQRSVIIQLPNRTEDVLIPMPVTVFAPPRCLGVTRAFFKCSM